MQFFMPQTKAREQAAAYQTIIDSLQDQLRCEIVPRQIFSLEYTHDKKNYRAQVGQLEQLEHHYEIIAILEANVYIVVAQKPSNNMSMSILVNKDEVYALETFA